MIPPELRNLSPDQLEVTIALLREEARADFNKWRPRIEPVLALPKKLRRRELKRIAAAAGVSFKTAEKKLDAATKHGLVGLVNCALAGPQWWVSKDKAGLCEEDKTILKTYLEQNQRCSAPAIRKLLWDYNRGRVQTATPLDKRTGRPVGWSNTNLYRHASTMFERTAMRQGLGRAIAKFAPNVLTTRVGLWVGSHYSFDDVKRDMEALLISRNQRVLVLELGAFDVFSGDRFAVHRRPQYDDNGRKDSLKEKEMRFLVANVFRNTGYSTRGTECIVELGTAAIRSQLAEFLHKHSNGLITVREPGITGREQAITGYWGRGGGNPRHKSRHESHHNLLQNEAGDVPAQVGHDRKPPEWLHGIEAVTQDVCRALATLPQDKAELLMIPMCEYWQLLDLLTWIDDRIAWRTDHRLEGWEKCGHTTVEFRQDLTSDRWLSPHDFLALPESTQQLITTAALVDPRYRRPRKLAPREVYIKGSRDLVRFGDHVIALMFCDDRLGEDLREMRSLTAKGEFDVTDQLAGPERMLFEGSVLTPKGEILNLENHGTNYGTVLNPWDPRRLWVYSSTGEYLGTAPRRDRASLLDQPGIQRQLGQQQHAVAELVKPLRDRHGNVSKEFELLQLHNEKITTGKAVTDADRKQERKSKSRLRFGRALKRLSDAGSEPSEEVRASVAPNSAASQSETEEIW